MTDARAALRRLCDPATEVSAHYLIGRDGTTWQMVDEADRAWHAGQGSWAGQDDINSRSIGIELDNTGDHPFAAPQFDALEAVLADILQRWSIPPRGVIGHADMAPDRKNDPGPRFDWARLERAGLAAHADRASPRAPDRAEFRRDAVALGYPGEASDSGLLAAVRARHRPFLRGPLAAEDMGLRWALD